MKSTRVSLLIGTVIGMGAACGGSSQSTTNVVDQGTGASSLFAALRARSHSHIEGKVTRTDLIADQAGKAAVTDPHLLNAWGLAFNPMGPAWVSSNGNGTAEVYDSTGKTLLEVTIPVPSGGMPPSAPTGQVFNGASATSFKGDIFIIVTEDGTIAGWQKSDDGTAVLRVDSSSAGAIYKGVTIATTLAGKPQLYAADFHNAKVDVFDASYAPVTSPGGFKDTMLPDGYAPFNVLGVGSFVIVTYAKQDDMKEDDVKGAGFGFVDAFTADGALVQRLIMDGTLNAPWGLAVQADTIASSIDLLVGNFGDGHIHVYGMDLNGSTLNVRAEGELMDATGAPIVIDGLWAIEFGPDAGGFSANDLFFTAGPNDEMNGLFGKLTMGTDAQ